MLVLMTKNFDRRYKMRRYKRAAPESGTRGSPGGLRVGRPESGRLGSPLGTVPTNGTPEGVSPPVFDWPVKTLSEVNECSYTLQLLFISSYMHL
jgi:hypothetical protein